MADQPQRVRHVHPAKDQRPPRHAAVYVVSDSYAHHGSIEKKEPNRRDD
jgi:hypothetical protein